MAARLTVAARAGPQDGRGTSLDAALCAFVAGWHSHESRVAAFVWHRNSGLIGPRHQRFCDDGGGTAYLCTWALQVKVAPAASEDFPKLNTMPSHWACLPVGFAPFFS